MIEPALRIFTSSTSSKPRLIDAGNHRLRRRFRPDQRDHDTAPALSGVSSPTTATQRASTRSTIRCCSWTCPSGSRSRRSARSPLVGTHRDPRPPAQMVREDGVRPPRVWSVPAGHNPTVEEAIERLELLRRDGPTPRRSRSTRRSRRMPPDRASRSSTPGSAGRRHLPSDPRRRRSGHRGQRASSPDAPDRLSRWASIHAQPASHHRPSRSRPS